jgi:O-methyltransferase involved in polyketide biosynthesis
MDTTEHPERKPATAARIYDFYIGGTHNFPADRAAAQAAIDQVPLIRPAARANRAFLARAVRFAAEAGIRQFLDIGSGIPTEGNVHEIAQQVDPESHVVYVDIDPMAVTEGLEVLRNNRYATSIHGDVRDCAAILSHAGVARLIDFSQPVAVIMCALLHFIPDDAAHAAVAGLRAACAPGSYLILSHGTPPDVTAAAQERAEFAANDRVISGVYARSTTTPVRMRPRAEIAAFFAGYDLVDPGLTWVGEWHAVEPDQPEFAGQSSLASILGGVGSLRRTDDTVQKITAIK